MKVQSREQAFSLIEGSTKRSKAYSLSRFANYFALKYIESANQQLLYN